MSRPALEVARRGKRAKPTHIGFYWWQPGLYLLIIVQRSDTLYILLFNTHL